VHWSDMLAVRPEHQRGGIGRQLKEFQRREVARDGVSEILWTYDPLVARNAHLNFNVLGVRVIEYVTDMYGHDTGSSLHRGIGTDRLIVAWPVADADLARQRRQNTDAQTDDALRDAPVIGDPKPLDERAFQGTALRIIIPDDIYGMIQDFPDRAAAWRQANRAAFVTAHERGFRTIGFLFDTFKGCGYYLLKTS